MKKLVFILLLLPFAGCDNGKVSEQAVTAEDSIKGLRKPTAYKPVKAVNTSPVSITESEIIEDAYGSKSLAITVRNVSDKTVDAIKFEWLLKDNFGAEIEEGDNAGQVQKQLKPGSSATYQFKIYQSLATKINASVTAVHFTNGGNWSKEIL